MEQVADMIGDLPDMVEDVVESVQDFLGDAADAPKQAADEVVADFSDRQAEPLVVGTVAWGAIEGKGTLGEAERVYQIEHAEKKYNTWVPGADEWVTFDNEEVVGRYFVPKSGTHISIVDGRKLVVTLSSPERDPNFATVSGNPVVPSNKPQIVAQVGQIPGAETSAGTAVHELEVFADELEKNDHDLQVAASCWAMESVESLITPVLESQGLDVITSNTEPDHFFRDTDLSNNVSLVVNASAYNPSGSVGVVAVLGMDDCKDILPSNSRDEGNDVNVSYFNSDGINVPVRLPRQTIGSVTLEQEG